MELKAYQQTNEKNLPPSLEAGTVLSRITKIEDYTFELGGQAKQAMHVFADNKQYRTSSGVLMKQLHEFFDAHPNETLDNVKVRSVKNYLTLVPSN